MSLDYPLYQEMRRRKSRGARYWRLGDGLYYIGLLAIIVGAPAVGIVSLIKSSLLAGVVGTPATAILGFCVFYLGASLKALSYRIAESEGIDCSKY